MYNGSSCSQLCHFELKYNVWLFFLEESWWTFCCIQGYQRISEDLGTGDTCTRKTIKDRFFQCENGIFFDIGGGGLLWSDWANIAFRLYFKTSSQNKTYVQQGKNNHLFLKNVNFYGCSGGYLIYVYCSYLASQQSSQLHRITISFVAFV